MLRKITLLCVIILAGLLFITGCNQPGSNFTTKEDSLNFAKAYFDQYPEENSVKTKLKSDTGSATAVQPISWEEVLRYRDQYDKQPLIYNLKGEALKGFAVDANGYNQIKMNNNIRGLYLRLARKDDGTFTIMLLGTDDKGNVIGDNTQTQLKSATDSSKDSDFDYVDPCPANCPPNFQ